MFAFKKEIPQNNNASLVFVNRPIDEEKDDIVGFSSQVSTICESIKDGATMIGVVADYGTGKSSLTELLAKTVKRKPFKYPMPININMWDCLQITNSVPKETKPEHEVSELTKTFLYQMACGNDRSHRFSSYINKRLSKNYGNISFSVSSRKFWWWFIGSVLSYTVYAVCSQDRINFRSVINNEIVLDLLKFCRTFCPVFLVLAVIMLIPGIIDTCVAFSHWKEVTPRDTEINDVFDVYQSIVRHIKPRKRKKQIIIIEDLDRVVEKSVIIGFLKELYRFQNLTKPYADRFAFVVSIKPESQLNNVGKNIVIDDKNAYSKLFDTIVSLKPIHYDDYDSLLLKLINGDPDKKQRLENIIGEEINDNILPESFIWIKTGQNLSLRDLKDRLNHAIMIMSSRKSYKVKTDVSFEACAAVTYLESQYPKEYYWLIDHEKDFAELMKKSVEIINTDKVQQAQNKLADEIKKIFKDISGNPNSDFVSDLCHLIYKGTFNYDFRMYFYTYPKGSHIKTTEERELCDMLLMPMRYHNYDDIDNLAETVYADGDDNIVTSTLKGLEIYPEAIIMNSTLLRVACNISWSKVADTIDKCVIKSDLSDKYAIGFWTKLHNLQFGEMSELMKKIKTLLIDGLTTTDRMIRTRRQIIKAFDKDILCFSQLFDQNNSSYIPLISEEEISLINDVAVSIQLIDTDNLSISAFGYISKLLCFEKLACIYDTEFQKAISVLKEYVALNPANLAEVLLSFMDINLYADDEFFEKVCLDCEQDRIAQYVNKLDAEKLSDKYLGKIDDLGFSEGLSERIITVLAEKKLYYTVLLSCAKAKDFSPIEHHLDNKDELINACKAVWKADSNSFYAIRWQLCMTCKDNRYDSLFFDDFPMISKQEYVAIDDNKKAIKYINTVSAKPENYSSLLPTIYAKDYSNEELVFLFDWLFNTVNSDIPLDSTVFDSIVDKMDFKVLNIRNLGETDRETVYALVEPAFERNNLSYSERLDKLNCLVPSVEKKMTDDEGSLDEYFALIQKLDEFTSFSLKYLSEHYIDISLSDKLSRKLKENEDYENYITTSVLRKNNMIIDADVQYDKYVNVYLNVPQMYEIMSDHWDFLEGLQTETHLDRIFKSSRKDELIPPMYKVPQHKEFFCFMLSDRFDDGVKKAYLVDMGEFASDIDSSAFKNLICTKEHIELLGNKDIYWKIRNNFKHKTEKAVFSRKWKERWGSKISLDD